jgi:hypothetical protein
VCLEDERAELCFPQLLHRGEASGALDRLSRMERRKFGLLNSSLFWRRQNLCCESGPSE